MTPQEYKKLITAAFRANTRRGFADWRNCGNLWRDVTDALKGGAEGLCEKERYADLFKLCNYAYLKWSNTDKDDSGGETQAFCFCVDKLWETVYHDGTKSISHSKMLDAFFEMLDGRLIDYMENDVYDFVREYFKEKDELTRKEKFLLDVMEDIKERLPENEILTYSLYEKEGYYARVLADEKRPIEEIRNFLNSTAGYGKTELLAQIEAEYGNYDESITLYKAIIGDRPTAYGADKPRKALMDIYKLQGDTKSYNEELYNMMLAHTGETAYFLEYKALFSEEEWEKEWGRLLEIYQGRLAIINLWLSIEGRYDLIMDNSEPDADYIVEAYEKELFDLYPDRCSGIGQCGGQTGGESNGQTGL